MDEVILVDEQDNEIGAMEKLRAHTVPMLHRAISVIVFNENGEMLIHRRASTKYHCPGLWTNACCSHPRPGEGNLAAAERRLKEEMGFCCELEEKFSFKYKTQFSNGLWEWEHDHVFVGHVKMSDVNIVPDKSEVEGFRWIGMDDLNKDIFLHPETYTYWFKEIMKRI